MSANIAEFVGGTLSGQAAAVFANALEVWWTSDRRICLGKGINSLTQLMDLSPEEAIRSPELAEAQSRLIRLLGQVRKVGVVDPETGETVGGLSIIKSEAVGVVGTCGGKDHSTWDCVQPSDAFSMLGEIVGECQGTIEGVFWLGDGRLVLEGSLPSDAKWRGGDAHEVRWTACLHFNRRADTFYLSLVRAVCANTVAMGTSQALGEGTLAKFRHSGKIHERWATGSVDLMAEVSETVAAYKRKVEALAGVRVGEARARELLEELAVGPAPVEPGEGASEAERKKHDAAVSRWANKRDKAMRAVEDAWAQERDSAVAMGIGEDTARVLWETVTRLQTHGGETVDARGEVVTGWCPPRLMGGRDAEGRRFKALESGKQQEMLDQLLVSVGLGQADALAEATERFLADMRAVEEGASEVDGAAVLRDMLG